MVKSKDIILQFKNEYISETKNIWNQSKRDLILENIYSKYKDYDIQLINNFLVGLIKSNQNKKSEAKIYFEKVLKIDETFPLIWNTLGTHAITDEEKINYYNKAISIDPTFVFPLYNLGVLHSDNSNYEGAISNFNKALNIDKEHGHSWLVLGRCYYNLKKFEQAEKSVLEALKIFPNYYRTYYNLALCYKSTNRYHDAHKYFTKSLQLVRKEEDNKWWISTLQNHIKFLENNIESNKILEDKKSDSEDDPTFKILSETIAQGIEEEAIRSKKLFLDFLSEGGSATDGHNYFQVLRRWNSYTPIIADNYHISKGGGYFLSLNSKGVVIDPGFNFIDNYKGSFHLFNEIDIVIISHAHNDHTSDLESILTLLYKYNKEIKDSSDQSKTNTIRNEIAKKKNINPKNVTTAGIEAVFKKSKRRKIIDF